MDEIRSIRDSSSREVRVELHWSLGGPYWQSLRSEEAAFRNRQIVTLRFTSSLAPLPPPPVDYSVREIPRSEDSPPCHDRQSVTALIWGTRRD